MGSESGELPLPCNLNEFGDVQYWEKFFEARNGRPFEWYGEWADLKAFFFTLLPKFKTTAKILVAGCGNSELSAHMYDAGWTSITNIDFSRVVIEEMLRLHVRPRPFMRWILMDMSNLQFKENCFDLVVDKGSLDALMGEAEERSPSASSYLSEVKRVLQPGGKFACITLAQLHVIEALLETFREGWLLNVHQLQVVSDMSRSQLHPFVVLATKCSCQFMAPVESSLGEARNLGVNPQLQSVVNAIKEENQRRSARAFTVEVVDEYGQLDPGRRTLVKLGGHYPAVVLDAKPDAEPPLHRCAVFLVPKGRAQEWLFSSVEGQWQVVMSAQAGRLIMVEWQYRRECRAQLPSMSIEIEALCNPTTCGHWLQVTLDGQQYPNDMQDVQEELSSLIKPVIPSSCRNSDSIPFMTTNDGLCQSILLEEVESPMTGTIQVEDVVVLEKKTTGVKLEGAKPKHYRRLVFRRNPNLIQSDALLVPIKEQGKTKECVKDGGEAARRHGGSKKKKKAKDVIPGLEVASERLKVDHSCLASEYHAATIAGLSLIASNLDHWVSTKQPIRVMIVGLGAGLLPMFVHNHIPADNILVVELDGVVRDVAKRHFGFVENNRMQLFVGDGIEAVAAIARGDDRLSNQHPDSTLEEKCSVLQISSEVKSTNESLSPSTSDGACHTALANLSSSLDEVHGNGINRQKEKLHVLIIDADSEDPSTGLSCPPAEFLEESFLRSSREALVQGGILAINLVSRASSPHVTSVAVLKRVFEEVYELEVEEDVNRVLFALPQKRHKATKRINEFLTDATIFKEVVTAFAPWGNGPAVEHYMKKLKRLK